MAFHNYLIIRHDCFSPSQHNKRKIAALGGGMGVIARQSIKGALANYLGVAIGFVVTFFVLTRYLTEEEVGLTRVLVDAAMLFTSLAQLGTNASVIRYFPHFKDGTTHHGLFGLSVLVPLVGWAAVALVLLLFQDFIVGLYEPKSPLIADYFYLVPMLTLSALYLTVFETNASVLMRITVPKMVREVGIRLFNLAAYLLYGFQLISLDLFVWLFCGSYLLAMLLNLYYLMKINHFRWNIFRIDWTFLTRERAAEMGRYSLFMTATVLAGNIPLLGSLFLGAKAGAALTGVYAIGTYIANVVEVPYRSLGAISRPVVAAAVKEENWGEVNRLVRQVSLHQLLVSLAIFYLIWINLDALYAIIPNGERYRGGTVVVLVLGMAKVLNSSFSIGTDLLNYSPLYTRALPLNLLLTAAAMGLNAWLIGPLGIGGAAAATLIAYLLYYALLLGFEWRRLRVSPFSWAQLKVLVLMGAAFGLNALWAHWLTPLFGSSWMATAADAVAKTAVLGALLFAATLAWHISPTLQDMITKRLKRKSMK